MDLVNICVFIAIGVVVATALICLVVETVRYLISLFKLMLKKK